MKATALIPFCLCGLLSCIGLHLTAQTTDLEPNLDKEKLQLASADQWLVEPQDFYYDISGELIGVYHPEQDCLVSQRKLQMYASLAAKTSGSRIFIVDHESEYLLSSL